MTDLVQRSLDWLDWSSPVVAQVRWVSRSGIVDGGTQWAPVVSNDAVGVDVQPNKTIGGSIASDLNCLIHPAAWLCRRDNCKGGANRGGNSGAGAVCVCVGEGERV